MKLIQLPWGARRIIKSFVVHMPDGKMGSKCRKWYYEHMQNVRFEGDRQSFRSGFNIRFSENTNVHIGSHVTTNNGVTIDCFHSDGVYLGKNIAIGPEVYFRSSNHNFKDKNIDIMDQGHNVKAKYNIGGKDYNIVIEDNVWIGARVIILSGAYICSGCVIGAGAVITGKKYEADSIIAGVPGKAVGKR